MKINNKPIYYNELINPKVFKILHLKEKPIFNFNSKVILGSRSFATFLSNDRRGYFKKNDILLIRIGKGNKEVQFVSKIQEWGKIHIPNKFTRFLDIKNHEKINFKIISKDTNLDFINKKDLIDLASINETVIPREDNYITLYVKGKTPITLPRFIKITPELIELFYLIHGDGHYQSKFYFVNKAPELHEFVLKQFESIFKFPRDLWKAIVLISNTNFGSQAKSYWKGTLNLNENQFYNLSKCNLNTSKRGNLRIIIDKTIFSIVFKFIFDKLKSLSKENSLHALNGLLYAEGGAQIDKVGLHKITLSFNQEEKGMFKQILDNLKLKYTIEQDRNFIIQNWDKLYLFFKIFLSKGIIPFKLHNKRRHNSIEGFLSHSFTKTMIKYLSTLKMNNNLTVKELSNKLGIRQDSVLDTIRKKRYQKFIEINRKGVRKDPFIVSTTKEGYNFLKIIETLRRVKDMKLPYEEIKMKVIVKKDSKTDTRFGCDPYERPVEQLVNFGIININKPQGPSSHQVSDYVKKILQISKAGHSGTLAI